MVRITHKKRKKTKKNKVKRKGHQVLIQVFTLWGWYWYPREEEFEKL